MHTDLQKLIYLHLSTDWLMKISLHLTGGWTKLDERSRRLRRNRHETVCRTNADKSTSVISM